MTRQTLSALEYRAVLVLVSTLSLYSFWWFGLDIGVRLDIWPTHLSDFDSYAFTKTQSPLNVIAFYIWVATKPLTVWWLLHKRWLAIIAHFIGIMANLADWVLLSTNVYNDGANLVALTFSFIETLLLAMMIRLALNRVLN
jgi:hypothetical protein